MNDFRIGLIFEEDEINNSVSFNSKHRLQISEIEEALNSGIKCRKEFLNYLYEIDRSEQLRNRNQLQVIAQNKISQMNVDAARIKYEKYVAELQERLEVEEEKVRLEIQRVKLEVEENIQKNKTSFELNIKKSKILNDLLDNELKQINEFDALILQEKERYTHENNSEIRKKYNTYFDLKINSIERIKNIMAELA